MEDGELCAEQEHTHSEECYEKRLICGLSEPNELLTSETADSGTAAEESSGTAPPVHHHTEECYEKMLVCGLEEHTHSPTVCPT